MNAFKGLASMASAVSIQINHTGPRARARSRFPRMETGLPNGVCMTGS